ncbi:MAG: hypothetical protein M1829_000811 [Trizodia sp. TS-e1964]|nr:MAG: hypothetical protein M1829_000811 [Trizodia sp. TS-e1964]
MSYAQVAASGPKQSPEERVSRRDRAPAPPQVLHNTDVSTGSLVDVDVASVHTVPSTFSSQPVQTSTQATRLELEEEDRAIAADHAAAKKAEQAKAAAKEAAKKTKDAGEKAKDAAAKKAEKAEKAVRLNADNPVVVANAVLVAGLSAALGFGAYRKYASGELSWKVVGLWAGAVSLFAAGDFYLSRQVDLYC